MPDQLFSICYPWACTYTIQHTLTNMTESLYPINTYEETSTYVSIKAIPAHNHDNYNITIHFN